MFSDGSELEIYASGIRNTVGFDWHPITEELWFTDNGRDRMGDNFPDDELNHAPEQGLDFGYPHCHTEVRNEYCSYCHWINGGEIVVDGVACWMIFLGEFFMLF